MLYIQIKGTVFGEWHVVDVFETETEGFQARSTFGLMFHS